MVSLFLPFDLVLFDGSVLFFIASTKGLDEENVCDIEEVF